MIIFTNPECNCCPYRLYNYGELKRDKKYLEEEPVPNCNKRICSLDDKDITRFINQNWVIKLSEGENKKGVKLTWQ